MVLIDFIKNLLKFVYKCRLFKGHRGHLLLFNSIVDCRYAS
jgi:hypothetical protein